MWEQYENVIAILCADLHLTIKPPIWRSAEPNWLEAQANPLDEIQCLQNKYNGCPILCAGDIFDSWNCSPELINWVIECLPDNMYCIPGQHDLPLHQYEDIHKSAYWTLVVAEKIENLLLSTPCTAVQFFEKIVLYGFPYGTSFKKSSFDNSIFNDTPLNIALVHDYVWHGNNKYPNAPVENHIGRAGEMIGNKFLGYDVIVYGDNHKGFCIKVKGTTIFNCGTLMRRASDEIDYKPQVGLLLESGKVIPYYLDISKDKYLDTIPEIEEKNIDIEDFIKELEKLGNTALDFHNAVTQFMEKMKTVPEVQKIVLEAMEKNR